MLIRESRRPSAMSRRLFTRTLTGELFINGNYSNLTICHLSRTAVEEFCGQPIQDSVYLHTLIIGLACIPTSLWLPLCVHKLGSKFFLVFSLVIAGGVTVGLYFVTNSTQNLILSSTFEALTSLGISLVYTVMVDLFPTNLR